MTPKDQAAVDSLKARLGDTYDDYLRLADIVDKLHNLHLRDYVKITACNLDIELKLLSGLWSWEWINLELI